MTTQQLLINELKTYLNVYKTTNIFYNIGVDIQSDYSATTPCVGNYIYKGLDNILKVIDNIVVIDDDTDEFLDTLQQVSIKYDDYTDDLIINEIINKFNIREK